MGLSSSIRQGASAKDRDHHDGMNAFCVWRFSGGGGIQVGDEIDMKYLYIYIFTTYAKASQLAIEDPAIIQTNRDGAQNC